MYTTHEFYTNKYLQGRTAVLDTANFPYWERKASMIIQNYTFNRIDVNKPVLEVVQMCTCELTEWLFKKEKSGIEEINTKGVSSESNSHYSVSFESAEKRKQAELTEQMEIINLWLSNTGLLYRGLDNVCR